MLRKGIMCLRILRWTRIDKLRGMIIDLVLLMRRLMEAR